MVAISVRAPGVSVMRSRKTSSITETGRPSSSADALAQGRLEGDLAAHGALGDGGDVGFQAGIVGELVDAFLLDHGGIHVGEEQLLAAVGGRLHHDVGARQTSARAGARPAHVGRRPRFRVKGMSAAVAGASQRGCAGAGKQQRARVSTASAASASGRRSGSRHKSWMQAAKRGAYCRADRQRQVGAGAAAGREARRHDRQCQLHAGLSRSAHHHRAADAGGRSARAAPALRPCRCGGELFDRAMAARRRRGARRTRARKAAWRSWSAAPGFISRR